MNQLSTLFAHYKPALQDWSMRFIIALIIVLVGFWLAKIIANYCSRVCKQRGQMDDATANFVGSVVTICLYVLVLSAALQKMGVPIASLLAVLGAAALGIGLALKDTLANIAAGLVLLFTRPYRAGDYVIINGIDGIIESIGLFQTKMRSTTNQEITVPNGSIVVANIVNYSIRPTRRLDYTFRVSYQSDLRQARQIIREVIDSDKRFHQDPEPILWTSELADSNVNVAVKAWTDTALYWDVRSDFIERIKTEFDNANISIPFPHQVTMLYSKEDTDKNVS